MGTLSQSLSLSSHQTQTADMQPHLQALLTRRRASGARGAGADTWHLVPSGSGRSSVHTGPSSHPVVWAERALAAGRRRTAVHRGLDGRQRETGSWERKRANVWLF